MRTSRCTAWTAAAGVLAVALAASRCQGGSEADPEGSPSGAASSGSAAEGRIPGSFIGPLEEILGGTAIGISTQRIIESTRQQEEGIATCMHEQGFEYTPDIPNESDITVSDGPVFGSREYVTSYGYGIWNKVPDVGNSYEISRPVGAQQHYVDAMSDAEREAHETALEGPVVEENPEEGWVMRAGGCRDTASGLPPADSSLAMIRAVAEEFLASLALSSELDEVNSDWAACMREVGYNEASPYLAQQRFTDAHTEATKSRDDPRSGPEGDAVAAEELAVAGADLDCQTEVDYVTRYDEIDRRLQEEYVDAHQADLNVLIAAASATE